MLHPKYDGSLKYENDSIDSHSYYMAELDYCVDCNEVQSFARSVHDIMYKVTISKRTERELIKKLHYLMDTHPQYSKDSLMKCTPEADYHVCYA